MRTGSQKSTGSRVNWADLPTVERMEISDEE
jgi:hypothetical protein